MTKSLFWTNIPSKNTPAWHDLLANNSKNILFWHNFSIHLCLSCVLRWDMFWMVIVHWSTQWQCCQMWHFFQHKNIKSWFHKLKIYCAYNDINNKKQYFKYLKLKLNLCSKILDIFPYFRNTICLIHQILTKMLTYASQNERVVFWVLPSVTIFYDNSEVYCTHM